MDARPNILFLCVANSARSQMAEGIARTLAPEGVKVWSAGSEPSHVRPQAIAVMKEWDIDLTTHHSKGVEDVPLEEVGLVITLCAEEVCPILPADTQHLPWPLPDPAGFEDEPMEKQLQRFRVARNDIATRLKLLWNLN